MAEQRYRVSIQVDLDTGRVTRGGRELDTALNQISRRQLDWRRRLAADETKVIQRANREQARELDTHARDVSRTYERHLGSSFFTRLARNASAAFKSNFSVAGIGTGGGGLGGVIGGALSVAGGNLVTSIVSGVTSKISGAIQTGFDFNKIKEQTILGFEIKLKNRDEALRFFDQINGFAEKAPLELGQVLDTTQRLMSAFSSKEALFALDAITDAVSATGKVGGEAKEAIDGIGLALQQIIFKNKLQAEEVLQLNERQINAWKYLAKEIARTDQQFAALSETAQVAKVQELARKGMLEARTAVAVILKGMKEEYGGTAERIARETLAGIESNTADRLNRLAGQSTEAAFGRYKKLRQDLLDLINSDTGDRAALGINKSVDALLTGMDAAFDAVRRGDFSRLGFDALGSAAAGIKSAGKSLYGAATDAAGQIEEGWRDRLQQRSPSRVLLALGEEAGLSLVTGFMQGVGGARFTDEIDRLIQEAAQKFGVDPDLIRAVITQESGGRRRAVSPKGASGLMQLMPGTARRYGVRDVFDPAQNIRGGTHYLADLLAMFGGRRDLALAGYNWGEHRRTLQRAYETGRPVTDFRLPAETRNYLNSITGMLNRQDVISGASGGSRRGGFGRAAESMPFRWTEEWELDERSGRMKKLWPVRVGREGLAELERKRDEASRAYEAAMERERAFIAWVTQTFGPSASELTAAQVEALRGRYAREQRAAAFRRPPAAMLPGEAQPPLPLPGHDPLKFIGLAPDLTQELKHELAILGNDTIPQALRSTRAVAESVEDAFTGLPPLIKKSADEADEAARRYDAVARDIAGAFGGSFADLLTGNLRGAFGRLRSDILGMLVGLGRDLVSSEAYKFLRGEGGGTGSGGGGLLQSLGRKIGGFLDIGPGGTAPFNPGAGIGVKAAGGLAPLPLLGHNPLDLLRLSPSPALADIIPPVSATTGAGASAARGAATTAAQAATLGSLFKGFGFGLRPGTGGALSALAPLLGLSLGAQLGRGGLGSILGGAGGLLAGAGLTAAPSALAGTFLAPLFSNPFTAVVGGALLVGGLLTGRSRQRRQEERARDQVALDVRSQIYQLIADVRADRQEGSAALATFQTLKQQYLAQAAQLKDSKTRRHAQLWWMNDLEPATLPKLRAAAEQQKGRRAVAALFHETYAVPGFARGGATWPRSSDGAAMRPFGGRVPGVYDRRDDKLIRVSGDEVVLTPEHWRPIRHYLEHARVPGFQAGGAAGVAAQAMAQTASTAAGASPIVINIIDQSYVDENGIMRRVYKAMGSPDGQKLIINLAESRVKTSALRRT